MRKAELLKRIDDLERRLAWAEQRLSLMPSVFAPAQPFIGPTVLPQPMPTPIWPPGYVPNPTIISVVGGALQTAEVPLCPYPLGEDRAAAGVIEFVAQAAVDSRTVCGTAVAMHAAPAMCIGAASAQSH